MAVGTKPDSYPVPPYDWKPQTGEFRFEFYAQTKCLDSIVNRMLLKHYWFDLLEISRDNWQMMVRTSQIVEIGQIISDITSITMDLQTGKAATLPEARTTGSILTDIRIRVGNRSDAGTLSYRLTDYGLDFSIRRTANLMYTITVNRTWLGQVMGIIRTSSAMVISTSDTD